MPRWLLAIALRFVVGWFVLVLAASFVGGFIPSGQIAIYTASWSANLRKSQGGFHVFDVDRNLLYVGRGRFAATYISPAALSPDQQQLALAAESDIYVMALPGFQARNVSQSPTSNEFCASWSPDGQQLLFTRSEKQEGGTYPLNYSIGVMDVKNGQVIYHPVLDEGRSPAGCPVWSPDGSRFVLMTYGSKTLTNRLEVVKIDQGQMATQFSFDEYPPKNPHWSADGKWLAFEADDVQPVTEKGYASPPVINQLWLMDTAANEAHLLVKGKFNYLVWSPDDKQIAYTVWQRRDETGYFVLKISNIETHETRQLTDVPESVYYPSWSPDGHWVAVVSQHKGVESVDVFDSSSGERQRLAIIDGSPSNSGGGYVPHQWSADGRWLAVFTNYFVGNSTSFPRLYLIDVENRSLPYGYYEYRYGSLFGFLWYP